MSESGRGSKSKGIGALIDALTGRRSPERQAHLDFEALFEAAPIAIVLLSAEGSFLKSNSAMCRLTGYAREEIVDLDAAVRLLCKTREDRYQLSAVVGEMRREDTAFEQREIRIRRKDGSFRDVLSNCAAVSSRGLDSRRFILSFVDITDRKRVEETVRILEKAIETSQVGITITDAKGTILFTNPADARMHGHRVEELIGKDVRVFAPRTLWNPMSIERLDQLQTRRRESINVQRDGTVFPVRLISDAVRDDLGRPVAVVTLCEDITERRRLEQDLAKAKAELEEKVLERTQELRKLNEQSLEEISQRKRVEEALRESERRFRTLFEAAPVGIYRATPGGRIVLANPTLVSMLGCSTFEELASLNLERVGFGPALPRSQFHEIIDRDSEVRGFESVWDRRDGSSIAVRENTRALRNPDGSVLCYQGVVEDVTERRRLEEQLRQAQKMEALGRLAGGVAHDFNNLLTAIIGYSDLLLMRLKQGDPLRSNAEEIKKAGGRASALTRQLLAFSRKQVLQPVVLDLNTVITDMEKMLRRLIGEDIRLVISLQPEIGLIKADPGQIEQVVMNLVVNARDAMPDGGTLTIETVDEAGGGAAGTRPRVMLTLADTGCGMTPEVRAHLFEPFFTTKQRGTGLGLSTVYGIIVQSRGEISVTSEPGQGTVFRIYLPRIEGEVGEKGASALSQATGKGSEVVLLVEDEEVVRNMSREVLQMSGYTVLVAGHGEEALSVSRQHSGMIHLMVTDVVMPGMSGRELARRLAADRSDMRVLFVSGYTDDQIVHHGVLDEGIEFLQKPFSPSALVQKVRAVLDAGPGARSEL
ncbi:MAG: PAS domain S-box protein [Acidobacteria bacterium]|nr:PAS domain S-box protein [Acidobacteriota bacterium]